VPEDLRKLVGKREEKRSLQTRDPAEAKRRHAEALAEIEARWANLRAGPKALTEREAHQMAMPIHDRWLQQHRDNPSQQTAWNVDLADQVFVKQTAPKSFDFLYDNADMVVDRDRFQILQMEKWCLELADECAMVQGFVIDDNGRRVLPRFAATTTTENFLEEVMAYEFSREGDWHLRPNVGSGARVAVTA
jgi:hypothetical protein